MGLADQHDVRVAYSSADMGKPAEVAGLIEEATEKLGRVDVLVNNAVVQHTAPVHEFPVDRREGIIAINLSAAFHAIRAVLPSKLERDWGRIIKSPRPTGWWGPCITPPTWRRSSSYVRPRPIRSAAKHWPWTEAGPRK